MSGWKALSRQAHNQLSETPSGIPFTQARLQDQMGTYGNLWFSTVDEQGRWLETPELQRSFSYRWKLPGSSDPTTYRFQVLAPTYSPMSQPEQDAVRDFFSQARTLLWKQLSAQMRSSQ
jgi:hypothetical protein